MTQRSSPPPDPSPHERLTAATLHELRTPLTVIKAQAQMMARWVRRIDHPDGEPALARLAMIDAMVQRLSEELDRLRTPTEAGSADDDQADR